MADWRELALAETRQLKIYWVEKHGWQPEVAEHDERIDLFIRLRGRRFGEDQYVLRLRYFADWQTAGRREAFVDANDHEHAGAKFWPPQGNGINPNHNHGNVATPVICLRGVWGFHSVLHVDQPMDGAPLLRFLIELQGVLDG